MINLANLRDPATLHRSPMFTKLVYGPILNGSNPRNQREVCMGGLYINSSGRIATKCRSGKSPLHFDADPAMFYNFLSYNEIGNFWQLNFKDIFHEKIIHVKETGFFKRKGDTRAIIGPWWTCISSVECNSGCLICLKHVLNFMTKILYPKENDTI